MRISVAGGASRTNLRAAASRTAADDDVIVRTYNSFRTPCRTLGETPRHAALKEGASLPYPPPARPGASFAAHRCRRQRPASLWLDGGAHLRTGRRARVFLEPTHHVELRANIVGRLRPGAVILLVELEQRRRHTAHLERRVVLLGLRHRRSAIEDARHEPCRRR